jgi:alkaline phosphatase D
MILSVMLTLLASQPATLDTGPLLGDLTTNSVRLWLRTNEPGQVEIGLSTGEDSAGSIPARTTASADNTATVAITGLKPDTRYRYTIDGQSNDAWWFRTRATVDSSCRIAFGSCANEKPGSSTVWDRLNAMKVSSLVLLGDTPYIDTTDLETQRRRHRVFASVPAFARLVAHTPVYATWDDHDFGRNDTDGNLAGKENSRKAFAEYRPNPSCGESDQGIYTSFRQGPVEVFLLDARWFAQTEDDPATPTLLGTRQWDWLERGLRASTAPFKVLACGMVFNGAVRPGKTDCWGKYPAEYARLIDLLARTKTTGALLVSGDVHWSRAIRHDTKEALGYELTEFVTSPIHEHLIKAADAPHPGLRWSLGEPNSFLILEAGTGEGTPALRAKFLNAQGTVLYSQSMIVDRGTD